MAESDRTQGTPELVGPAVRETLGIGALTLCGFLGEVCARFPDHEALVFDDPLRAGATTRWTYADLLTQSRRVAKALVAHGTEKGDFVGTLMSNRPEAVAALFGTAMAGAVAVPLSTFATAHELDFLISDADLRLVMFQTRMGKRNFADDLDSLTLPEELRLVALDSSDDPGNPASWEVFLDSGNEVREDHLTAICEDLEPHDLGLVIYSSGTTDKPKGAVHNHRAPTMQFWVQSQIFGRHERTRLWTALPLFWTAGINTALGSTLAAGGCVVMQEGFDAGVALMLMERERVTEPYTLPHQAKALEQHPSWLRTDLSSLTSVYGKSVFTRHPSVNGDPNWLMPVGYGLSETCAFFAAHYSSAPKEQLRESIGRLLPGNVLRVVDPDTDQILGAGEQGELLIKGPTLMERYVGKTKAESLDANGFFHTGDMGSFDADGFVHWTGRRTEMIKSAGANISPAEIEVQLRACQPVKLSRVIGVGEDPMNQTAILCLELKDGASANEDDVRAFLKERIASYKVPKQILFFEEGTIPMTASGTKVKDDALLTLVRARLSQR